MKMSLERKTIDTDVLIVGGGGAGAMAAIKAVSEGADVLVATKGPYPSGNSRFLRVLRLQHQRKGLPKLLQQIIQRLLLQERASQPETEVFGGGRKRRRVLSHCGRWGAPRLVLRCHTVTGHA